MEVTPVEMSVVFHAEVLQALKGPRLPSIRGTGRPLPADVAAIYQRGFEGLGDLVGAFEISRLFVLERSLLKLITLGQVVEA